MKGTKEFFGKLTSPLQTSPSPSSSPTLLCKTSPCVLCERSTPTCLMLTPSWCDIAQVTLYCLHKADPSSEYIELKSDLHTFVDEHFDLLNCCKTASRVKWKKLLSDSLAHNKDVFECKVQDKGLWKLVAQVDPWTEEYFTKKQINDSAKVYSPSDPNSSTPKDRKKRSPPYLPKRPKLSDERESASLEEEFRELQKEITSRMETMKKEVEFFKSEVRQRHEQNIIRIQQMDDLLGTFAPGLISTLQKYVYVTSRQSQPGENKEEVADTVLAIEGLEEIHNQWRENKDMRHCISFITS